MSSKRRRASSRANGSKSHGPVTPEGKARSAANAPTRHGLASPERAVSGICLRNENPAEFTLLHEALITEHAPVTTTEHLIVHEMAVSRWRLHRAWNMETALLDNQMDHMIGDVAKTYDSIDGATRAALAFRDLSEKSPALPVLLRYETRLSRQFDRCLTRLAALRADRAKANLPAEPNPGNEHQSNDPQLQHRQPAHTAQRSENGGRQSPIVIPAATPQMASVHDSLPQHDREPATGPSSTLPRAA